VTAGITPAADDARLAERAFLIPLRREVDPRGALLPLDFHALPFRPQRIFTVSDVPPGSIRGRHAHRSGRQLLVCLQGRISVTVVLGEQRTTFALLPGGPGLLVEAGVWGEQCYDAADSVLLVLCSEPYDAASYLYGEGAAG
jgi:hypothetical protein